MELSRGHLSHLLTQQGVFVLQSNLFPPLAPLSTCRGTAADLESARVYLVFPQALIQGALVRLGMNATVTAETASLPQCEYYVVICLVICREANIDLGTLDGIMANISRYFPHPHKRQERTCIVDTSRVYCRHPRTKSPAPAVACSAKIR